SGLKRIRRSLRDRECDHEEIQHAGSDRAVRHVDRPPASGHDRQSAVRLSRERGLFRFGGDVRLRRSVMGPAGYSDRPGQADAGIKTPYDLKGKRIGYVKGNPSVNVKQDAYLAFAGLTRDDIEVVWYGSYAALKDAVIQNQIDGYSSVTTSGNMREIEASPR